MCFDCFPVAKAVPEYVTKSEDVEDIKKLQEFSYLPCIGNDLINLKVKKATEETKKGEILFYAWREGVAYEDITSLDQTVRNDLRSSQLIFKDFYDYLTYEQKEKDKISGKEIIEILNKLNSKEYKLEEKLKELAEQDGILDISSYGNYLKISKKEEGKETKINDDFYKILNIYLEEGNVNRISFYNIDNTLDLSKVDTSKVTEKILHFENYEGALDCFSLTGDIEIHFTNTNGSIASQILKAIA